MNRSRPARWALFKRQIIQADYSLSGPLFSPLNASSDDPTARFYLEKDNSWRSKLIALRVRGCVDSLLFTIAFAALLVAFVGMMMEGSVPGDTVFVTVIAVPCLYVSAWSLMKAHSWLRWMVRNWNTQPLAPRGRKISRADCARRQQFFATPVHERGAGIGTMGEIVRVWFHSQFVRVTIKADYRVGDSVFASTAMPGLPGGTRDYPEEYLSSGKVWRCVMMLFRAVYLVLAVTILWVTAPWKWESGFSFDPVTCFFYGILVMVLLRLAIPAQSFLRWMIRNWSTERYPHTGN